MLIAITWLILLLTGWVAGTIGSLAGLGGGVIIVPVLLYLGMILGPVEVTPQIAVGTSLFVVIVTAISSTLSYAKQKKIDFKSGLIFVAASGPGAVAGGYLNGFLEMKQFQLYFGSFIILLSLLLMIRDRLPAATIRGPLFIQRQMIDEETKGEYVYGYSLAWALPIAFVVGMLSGMFGIGGGSLMVPAMILLFQFPTKTAVATSMFMILFSSISGSAYHLFAGNVDWMLLIGLVPGAWIGGKFGAYLAKKLKSNGIVMVLRIVLIVIGLRMILEYLS